MPITLPIRIMRNARNIINVKLQSIEILNIMFSEIFLYLLKTSYQLCRYIGKTCFRNFFGIHPGKSAVSTQYCPLLYVRYVTRNDTWNTNLK